MPYTSTRFFQLLPGVTREYLPAELRKFRVAGRPWLAQLHYGDPRLHYEVWNLGQHRARLEIGLHFESRDSAVNWHYLRGFDRRLFEIKSRLGAGWEAEPWDRGWTKVYEVWPLEPFNPPYLERVAKRLAESIVVLQPMFEELQAARQKRVRATNR